MTDFADILSVLLKKYLNLILKAIFIIMFIHLAHFAIICKEDYFVMTTWLNSIKNSGEGYLVIFVAWTMSIFCWYSDMIMEWQYFVLIHPSHGVALSDVNVLWNCSCSTREHHRLIVGARPATLRPGWWYQASCWMSRGFLFLKVYFYDLQRDFFSMVWGQECSTSSTTINLCCHGQVRELSSDSVFSLVE